MQEHTDSNISMTDDANMANRVVVLTAVGEALQAQLGGMFRQKKPFALSSLEGMTAEALTFLQATAKKRRVCVYVLGGWRVCPPMAALKELVSGGCLGEIERIRCTGPLVWQLFDVCHWLSPTVQPIAEETVGEEITVSAEGTAGRATARFQQAAWSGTLVSHIQNHERQREFAAADIARIEQSLLQTFGQERHIVPGLVPASELQPVILKAGPRQDMSRGVQLACQEGAQSSPTIIPPQKNNKNTTKKDMLV